MRTLVGWICYASGAVAAVLAIQLFLSCELIAAFNRVENLRFDFWDYLFFASGHHGAYPNGYLIHVMRDLAMLVSALALFRIGKEQFESKKRNESPKLEMISCPGCRKKTYADAYCRFCGFNLITNQPTLERRELWPVWKVSLLAYACISFFLLILNFILIKTS
jgi:hypothetical protein